MIKVIAIFIILIIAGSLIFAATQPDTFRVQRTLVIKALPENIFALINNFHAWEGWSPWGKIDPAINRNYRGADSGVGAVYAWQGNKEIGQGQMEIVESTSASKVRLTINFIKPFQVSNMIEFVLVTEADKTTVTQAMYGGMPYISKLMCLIFSMEKMVGPKYEEGLAALKVLAEK